MDDSVKQQFIQDAGWRGATEKPVGADWSPRRITRLEMNGRSAILMQSQPDDHPEAPLGHKIADYVRIGTYLRGLELAVPTVYAASPEQGLLLVEDFGTHTLHDLMSDPNVDQAALYENATDVLTHLYEHTKISDIALPNYYDSYVHTGRRRIMDWYAPARRLQQNEDGLVQYYLNIWTDIERSLPIAPKRFLHGDFHPHNLMWVTDKDGNGSIGILDFQQAMRGPAAYDLVNLLEDARRIVPAGIQNICLMQFQSAMSAQEWDAFSAWYPVLACQFHCRVIGQAIRLAVNGKPHLLEFLPIMQKHIQTDLLHPTLWPLESFFRELGIDFSNPLKIDIEALKPLIRDDAF